MSSEMKVNSSSAQEYIFYRVSAKVAPWDEQSRKTIGFYSHERVALAATQIVRENNMQRLPGGIDVFCDPFRGTIKEIIDAVDATNTVYTTHIDIEERDRLLSLRFRNIYSRSVPSHQTSSRPVERTSTFPSHSAASFDIQQARTPQEYLTPSFNPQIAGQNFTQGIALAQEYAQNNYGSDSCKITLSFHGTGICAMSGGPRSVDPIEVQEITLITENNDDDRPTYKKIGKVLPEKDHLLTLKTADEIASELMTLIVSAFQGYPNPKWHTLVSSVIAF